MLCQISGVFLTPNGVVHPSVTVKFRRSAGVHSYVDTGGPVTVIPDEVDMITDVDGEGTVSLYPGRYQVELFGSNDVSYKFVVNVPAEEVLLFSALLGQAADYGDGGQLETIAGYAAAAFLSAGNAAASETSADASEAAAALSQVAADTSADLAEAARVAAVAAKVASEAAQGVVVPLAAQASADAGTAAGAATTATTQAGIATTQAGLANASALAAATFDPALYLAKSGNLAGLLNTTTALTNLGATATGASLFTAADAAAGRTALGAVIGTDVQAYDADLAALAALEGVEGDIIFRNAVGWARLPKATDARRVLTQNAALTAPEWATPKSMDLLGTLTTTSGTSHTLSGLDLTDYKELHCMIKNVGGATALVLTLNGTTVALTTSGAFNKIGILTVALNAGLFTSLLNTDGSTANPLCSSIGISNATTSLTFSNTGAVTFTGGQINVFGVR